MNGSDHERNKDDSDEDVNSEDFDDDDEDDFNPFGSDSEDDDPWSKRSKKKKQKKAKKSKKNGSSAKKSIDPFQEKYAHLFQQQNKPKTEDRKTVMPPVSNLPGKKSALVHILFLFPRAREINCINFVTS